MFVESNGEIISFSEFLMSESIVPMKTEFGTDISASDGTIGDVGGLLYWTVIKHKDFFYMLYYSKKSNISGFGFSDSWNGDFRGEMEKFTSGSKNLGASAIKVFGNIFYVLIKLIEKSNGKVVKFDAADMKLGKVYDRMVKNKPFLNTIKKEGWTFQGKRDGFYIFTIKS